MKAKTVWVLVWLLSCVLLLAFFGGQPVADSSPTSTFFARLQLLPVLTGGLLLGWRIGLGIGMLSAFALLLTPPFQVASEPAHVMYWLDLALLPAVGLAAGLGSERNRKRVSEHQRVAGQLQQAHAEMRENFEGMKRAERLFAIGQLSAGLAHEIRNPLASISGAAGILRRDASTSEKHAELLEIIDKECQRLNGLLTNFLEYARPRPPQPGIIRIGTVVDRVIGLASHAPGRRNITIRQEISPDLPQVFVDAEQLQQVLFNMVMNAIQASSENDEVLLSARLTQDRLWVDVRDQGSGVKPEHVDRLFDPFFTTKEHGTGLGLPVAHEIVRTIGGMLNVKHNDDCGMTFSVGLPLSPRKDSHDYPPHSAG